MLMCYLWRCTPDDVQISTASSFQYLIQVILFLFFYLLLKINMMVRPTATNIFSEQKVSDSKQHEAKYQAEHE